MAKQLLPVIMIQVTNCNRVTLNGGLRVEYRWGIKISDFRPVYLYISETTEDRNILQWKTTRKSHTAF